MNISDEAVEAAMAAFAAAPHLCTNQEQMKLAVEAAAPHLMAQALRDAADELDLGIVYGWHSDRQYADYLRSKADDIRSAGAEE